MRTKVQGPRTLPKRWPGEALWGVMGHNGQYPFYCSIVVAGGVVRSAPPLASWMLGRDWLACAGECAARGWRGWDQDTQAGSPLAQEKARHARGSVQMGLEGLDGDRSVKPAGATRLPAGTPERQQRRSAD